MSSTLAEGTPLTEHAAGTGTQTASYTLPLAGVFVVESVVAEIDASGSGDATPTLTVADKSGRVIARKRQDEAVTAGTAAGSATWALRLAAKSAAGQSVETTDGAVDVSPTKKLRIGVGLVLTNSAPGEADIASSAGGLLYAYTVAGAPKATIDTFVDGPMAGLLSQAYHVLEVWAVTQGGNNAFNFNNDFGNRYATIDDFTQNSPPINVVANAVTQGNFAFQGSAATPSMCRLSIPGYASTAFARKMGEGLGGTVSQTAANNVGERKIFVWTPAVAAGISRIRLGGGLFAIGSALFVFAR